ncbi:MULTISPECIES: hypothetical protein [Paenibacillus]|uniref:Uncharacterized protein n=1 Tax=Paenibacillus azoreducens TaxID=116718 RepID=A0A919Y984_9BACL|nr:MULTISPECIES: hypothetical protein [Paenibacillus]MBE9915417.1 hypothetical protein [Paenibacillus donghaensis]GIO46471.1 hypothetical protein J34TS1_12360 [Paenibacillus azoreducens]
MKFQIPPSLISLMLSVAVFASFTTVSAAQAAPKTSGPPSAAHSGELKGNELMFGYTDQTGQKILGLLGDPDKNHPSPKTLTSVIYAPGKQFGVSYVKHQARSSKSNGRQNANNFINDEGELFKVKNAANKLSSDASVLLATKNAFQGHTFLSLKTVHKGKFSSKTVQAIEKAKNRKVVNHGLVATTASGAEIGLVEFAKGGGKPLASLVLADKNLLLFEDFIGNNDSQSTWRVDDGGEISAENFGLLFVSRSKTGYALGVEWYGPEGTNLTVLQQKGSKFRVVTENGRYQVP